MSNLSSKTITDALLRLRRAGVRRPSISFTGARDPGPEECEIEIHGWSGATKLEQSWTLRAALPQDTIDSAGFDLIADRLDYMLNDFEAAVVKATSGVPCGRRYANGTRCANPSPCNADHSKPDPKAEIPAGR